MNFIENTNHS